MGWDHLACAEPKVEAICVKGIANGCRIGRDAAKQLPDFLRIILAVYAAEVIEERKDAMLH